MFLLLPQPDVESRIVYCSFRIERLPSSLHFYNNSRSVVCFAEHVIDRPLQISLDRMHLLVYKFQIRNLSVRNHLIQKFNHDILRGLSSKDQLKHFVIKQVSILEFVQHNHYKLIVKHPGIVDRKIMLYLSLFSPGKYTSCQEDFKYPHVDFFSFLRFCFFFKL